MESVVGASCSLSTIFYQLPITNYPLIITNYELRITNYTYDR